MQKIEQSFKCVCHKFKASWYIDLIISRNKQGVALGEMKCRNVKSTQYATVILTLYKAQKGLELSNLFGLPFIFFVRFEDKDMACKILGLETFKVEKNFQAGNHAADPYDVKDVVHVPTVNFKEF